MTDPQTAPRPVASLAAATPPGEVARLAALRSYRVLDTPAEAAFDDIVQLASHICDTPIAVVNLIDSGRQWFKAEVGLGVRETPLDSSICAHAILQAGLFEIPDLAADARFECNPLVTGEPRLRFYAGALLQTAEGLPLGTVCVLDTRPRQLTPKQKTLLTSLARQTMTQLELRRALGVVSRANRFRSRLMAVAGHDLKQPLQVLSGVLERFERRDVSPRDRKWLSLARGEAQRMSADLDELAQASGLESSDLPDIEQISLPDVFGPLLDGWRSTADSKGLRFRTVLPADLVLTDARMLASMIGNLVNNALKYTERGGVLLGARRRGGKLLVEVVDTGPGVPAEELELIFEAFRQLNPEREGLGLGLSIVKQSAEVLGHTVSVSSALGRGSRFGIAIPRVSVA